MGVPYRGHSFSALGVLSPSSAQVACAARLIEESKTDEEIAMYEPSKHISTFHIAGFQHYDGALVLEKLKAGAPLELVIEPDNPHDPNAIQVRFEGVKLGYVPASENKDMALMMFYGHADVYEARVNQVDPEADPWKQVRMGVYVRDAR